MNYLNKIKDQFLEQFLPEQLIKELENEAEYIRKYIFTDIEKHTIEFENLLKTPEAIECNSKEFYEPQIEANKQILNMEPKYLLLKKQFKKDTGVRLSLAKDWNLYLKTLESFYDAPNPYTELTHEEKEETRQKDEGLVSKLKEIQNRFERLIN